MFGFTDVVSIKESSNLSSNVPEKELLIAILDRAVLDYCGREGELHEIAGHWIFNNDDLDETFSFNSICSYLGLNPSAVRERIKLLEIPKNVSQSHRWLRSKVQKTGSRSKKRASSFY